MSYQLEYRYAAFSFNAQRAHTAFSAIQAEHGSIATYNDYGPVPCVVAFVEDGSNNTYRDDNTRARSWNLQHVGEVSDVMGRVIRASEYVESGMTQPYGKPQRAENYITTYRKRIRDAAPLEQLFQHIAGSTCQLSIQSFNEERAARHPWWQKAVKAGWVYQPPYRETESGVRLTIYDSEQFECVLMALADIGNGVCGTMASFGGGLTFPRVLDKIHGGAQLSLLCA